MGCETLEAIQAQKVMDCQYHRARRAGDEIIDWCDLSDHNCVLAYGYDCEEGEEEWLKEEHEIKPRRPIRIVRDKLNGGE